MRDRLWISSALVLFVLLVASPFWYARFAANDLTRVPNLQLPATGKECVAPAAWMRTSHMQLLVSWREDVVRRGQRQFASSNGKVYEKSLNRTCLGCHNKQEFCDRCHTYAGVSGPYCWDCHSQPQSAVSALIPGTTHAGGLNQPRIATTPLPNLSRSRP